MTGQPGGVNDSYEDDLRIQERLTEMCWDYKIPGMVVVVIHGTRSAFFHYGYSGAKRKIKPDKTTMFEIASLSKAFTALGVLFLMEAGMLSGDDPLTKYLPELRIIYKGQNVAHKITVSDLLYHTSGFSLLTISLYANRKSCSSLESLVRSLDGWVLDNHPGTSYKYTSINYDLLSYIVEIVTKQPFDRFMNTEIFNPLGLNNTHFQGFRAEDDGYRAVGYVRAFMSIMRYKSKDHTSSFASGYIVSCMEDIERWMRIQMGQIVVPDFFRKLIQQSHIPDKRVPQHDIFYYSGGWNRHIRLPQLQHAGNNPGFSSSILLRMQDSLGICALANINSDGTHYVTDAIYRVVKGYQLTQYEADKITTMDGRFSILSLIIVLLGLPLIGLPFLHTIYHSFWFYLVLLILFFAVGGVLIGWVGYMHLKRVDWRLIFEWGAGSIKACYLIYCTLSAILLVLYVIGIL